MIAALHHLSTSALRALASSLKEGPLSAGLSGFALQQIAGPRAKELESCLRSLMNSAGMTASHIAMMADAIAEARAGNDNGLDLLDLVLSGPEVAGIPTGDTAAVMHTLIEEASSHVLLVGYTVHNGRRLFERLVERMKANPGLRVVFCLDIPRKYTDTSLPSEIVWRFAREFRTKHWPWPELPDLYYDPRSLAESTERRSSLHAKCIVIDRRMALITSANFTEAAQERNIEVGVLVRHAPMAAHLVGYFEALISSGQLVRCSPLLQQPEQAGE